MDSQPGKSDCPSFIQMPLQFSQKNLPFEGKDVEALSIFLLHISFQASHLILEKHPEKLLICCRQGVPYAKASTYLTRTVSIPSDCTILLRE